MSTTAPGHDERVLVLMPTNRDAVRTCAALAAVDIAGQACGDLAELCREVGVGAGAALLTEEAVTGDRAGLLAEALRAQPAWSDLPLVVLAHAQAQGSDALRESLNVTLVERPLRMRSLISVLRAALRSRRRQYEVRELLAVRQQAAEALRDQARRKDAFLALLAHELRNPLAPLRNGLQVMRLAAADADAVAQARDMMERQLGHMVRLIDDLLDVARINQNKMELRRARVALADIVNHAVETARPAIEAAGHELTLSLPAHPIHLDADLTRLAQVFSNLLTNSARYTDPGGRIWLSAEACDGSVLVAVRDTGIGIPAEALPRIFDMFSQGDRLAERTTGGLGIGLALVKGLVEMHAGSVVAVSAGQGQGSVFTVRLPTLAEAPATPPVPSANGHSSPGPGRRILVVDDNQDSATSMALMLELLGHDVRTAHDGIEAVDMAEAFRPQVILMDVGMPRLNGLDATRRIRARPEGEAVVIIALTGWGKEDDKAKSREAGCDGHLVKPVGLPDLEQLLTKLCGTRDRIR